MKKLTAAVFHRSGGGVAPSPPPPPAPSSPSAKATLGSILRIRLSLDLSPPSTEEEIVMAQRTDSHTGPASSPSSSPPPPPPATVVHIPRALYRLVWWLMLSVHTSLVAYLVVCAKIYSVLATTRSYFFTLLATAPTSTFPVISAGFCLLALFHIVAVVHIISVSVAQRRLAFHRQRSWTDAFDQLVDMNTGGSNASTCPPEPTREATLRMMDPATVSQPLTKRFVVWLGSYPVGQRLLRRVRWLLLMWDSLLGRDGVLGIDSAYFDVVVFARKFTVLSLQTGHAYLGSLYLSRRPLKNFLVWTVVMQCIATPAIHFYCQQRHAPMERVLYLASCAFFTLCCFVVAAVYLIAGIAATMMDEAFDLPEAVYFGDATLIRTVKHMQFLMIIDAVNAALVFVPLLAISQCMSAIKPMLGVASATVVDVHTIVHSSTPTPPPTVAEPVLALPGRRTASNYSSTASIAPTAAVSRGSVATERGSLAASTASLAAKLQAAHHHGADDHDNDGDSDHDSRRQRMQLAQGMVQFAIHHVTEEQVTQARQFRPQHHPITGVTLHALYVFFVLWAVAVLTFHVRASRTSQQLRQPGCHVEVRPWSTRRYACAVLEFDCVERRSNGSAADLEAALLSLHRRSLTTLVVSHCETVAMPPAIALFPRLAGLKMYNSTVAQWSTANAITHATHPRMSYAFFIRCNASAEAEVWGGLHSVTLKRLALVETNFSITAADQPALEMLSIERSGLTEWPQAIASSTRLNTLSLAWNDLRSIPTEALTDMAELQSVSMAGNRQLLALPLTSPSSQLMTVDVSDTGITSLLDGLPTANTQATVTVVALRTPLCDQQQQQSDSGYQLVCGDDSQRRGTIYPLADEDARRQKT